MKKSIERQLSTKKNRRIDLGAKRRSTLSRRALRHEVLEARQLLDANSLTFVLDFVETNQGQLSDKSGNVVAPFDATSFGFAAGDEQQIANAVLAQVRSGFLGTPDAGENAISPLPAGQELDIDIFIGDAGAVPINGASEYYTLLIGNTVGGSPINVGTTLQNDVRDGAGNPNTAAVGSSIGTVYVNNISGQFPAGSLTPVDALTTGNLQFTSQSIANSVLHELGQVLTLTDVQTGGAQTLRGLSPIMGALGTGGADSQPQEFISQREFAVSAISPEAGGVTVNPLQTLIDNVGTRAKVTLPSNNDTDVGPQLIGINPDAGSLFASTQDISNSGTPFDPNTLSPRNRLDDAPTELTFRFSSNAAIDSATLAQGIQITRSVNGIFGDADDVTVTPGFLGLDDSQLVVTARFSETLPDDSYRVRVFGFDDATQGILGVRSVGTSTNVGGVLFEPANVDGFEIDGVNDGIETLYFELELGAQVVAVVPQPIGRDIGGTLVQRKDQIVVYFNDDDLSPLADGVITSSTNPATLAAQPRVVQPSFYQLILTNNTVSGNDDVVVTPTSVSYDPSLDRAVLTFNQYSDITGSTGISDLAEIPVLAGVSSGDATFRLRIGSSDAVASAAVPIHPVEIDPALLRFTGSASDINFTDPVISGIPRDLMKVSTVGGGSATFEFTDSSTALSTVGNIPIVVAAGSTNLQIRDAILAALESRPLLGLSPVATDDGIGLDTRQGQTITTTNLRLGVSSDVGSSFGGADSLALGTLSGSASTLIRQEIRALDSYALEYPGGYDEQGLRDFDHQSHFTFQNGDEFDGLQGSAISRLYYNFNTSLPYGQNSFGQNLSNAITEAQKQRSREIFESLGQQWGIDFVETESHRVNGVDGVSLTIVTGDLVVLGATGVESGPGGFFGTVANTPVSPQQAHTFGRTVVLLDAAEAWFNEPSLPDPLNATRLSYYAHAMTLIVNALGVETASEAPPGTAASGVIRNYTLGGEENLLAGITYASNGVADLTNVNPVEPALPGDVDNVLGQHLYRPESRDIDVYKFQVAESGVFTAETFAERLNGSASLLDSYLSVYRNNGGVQELIARNDDYFGEDAFIELNLEPGEYFLAVSAAGNEAFDLALADSGMGGTSEGAYELLVNFAPNSVSQILDVQGTAIDGDGDGVAGGEFNFWFRSVLDEGGQVGVTPTRPRTLFVDKSHSTNTSVGQFVGTLTNPYNNIKTALAAARPGDTVRIVGNGGLDGNLTTLGDNFAYEIGRGGASNAPLSDGATMEVPQGVHVQIDAGAIFKLRDARIVAGSSSSSVDVSGGSLQVLGTPYYDLRDAADVLVGTNGIFGRGNGEVRFTSYNDQSIGVDTNPLQTTPSSGNWGGVEFKNDIDNAEGRANLERQGIFLNYVAHGDFQYGGGQVSVNSQARTVNPIHMSAARPTLLHNEIRFSANAAISADGDSFLETNFNSPLYQRNDTFVSDYVRVGPDIRGNVLLENSTNGLFVRVDTPFGQATRQVAVPARFDDTDIVHVIGENLLIQGTPGGPILEATRPPATGIVSTVSANSSSMITTSTTPVSVNYRITYVDRFGGESLPSNATTSVNVVAGQQVLVSSLPAATGEFIARRIYRSQPGGGAYELVAELDRNKTTFVDRGQRLGATLVALTAAAEPNVDSTLAAGNHVYRVGLFNDDPSLGQTEVVFDELLTVSTTTGQQVRLNNLPGMETSASPITMFGELNTGNSGLSQFRVIYRLNPSTGLFDVAGFMDLNQTSFVDDGSTFTPGTLTGVQPANMPTISSTRLRARPDARLAIDPGIIVKLDDARIETGYGAQLIAEGTAGKQVLFTSAADDRYGAGGTFDTNGDVASAAPAPGDWGGLYIGPLGSVSIDHAYIAYAGGVVETGGTFAGFNALEIIQSEARVANSIFENNASGLGGQAGVQRDGHGFNEPAVIFVRDAQPVIVDNVIRNNNVGQTAAISINVNALNSEIVLDHGRQTADADERGDVRNNFGPLIDGNRLGGNSINGMAVRGGTLTTEVVWDDTDIVHVVDNFRSDIQFGPELIQIPDLFTYGGLRLQSAPQESLVVKFGSGAEIIATGRPLDIEDRVGGTLHVLGAPGFPVILTSLDDDSVGAGFDPLGQALNDTNGNGTATTPAAGDWQGLVLDKFSNDRNVETVNELESPDRVLPPDAAGNNADARSAEFLGDLASSETTSDDNLRLGFTVHGVISRPSDVDVYSFNAQAGTEVWIDIDRTSFALDTVIEVINVDGEILALSDNSHSESTQTTTLLSNPNLLPADRVNVMQRDPFGPTNSIDGSFRDDYSTNLVDAGLRLTLPGSMGTSNTFFVRVRSNNQDASNPQPRDIQNDPNDGVAYENDLVGNGRTSGTYQLQLRIREQQEHGGSTIRQAQIRYATSGIEVRGLPIHSPLLGEASEPFTGNSDGNDTVAGAINLGTLNSTDRSALSVAGQIFDLPNGLRTDDVDFFEFQLEPESDDPRRSDELHTPIVIDIDYADGLARPNTTVWLYGIPEDRSDTQALTLIAFGTDSNVLDDQGAPNQGVDQSDLERGSAGPLDAWIGTLELVAGRYVVAVTNNSRISNQLEQFQTANPINPLARVEPITSVQRIASDHDFDNDGVQDHYFISSFDGSSFPTAGATTATPPVTVAFDGDSNRIDYTLSDVVLYVTSGFDLVTVNPFTGAFQSSVSDNRSGNTNYFVQDLAMRPDGNLYGFADNGSGARNDDNYDEFLQLATEGGDPRVAGQAGIQTFEVDPANGNARRALTQSQNNAPGNGDGLSYQASTFITSSLGASTTSLELVTVSQRVDFSVNALHDTNWIYRHNVSSGAGVTNSNGTGNRGNANGVVNGSATDEFESGTVVVERGYIDTTKDLTFNLTTYENTGSSFITLDPNQFLFDGDVVDIGTLTQQSNSSSPFQSQSIFEFDQGLLLALDTTLSSYADGDVIQIDDSAGASHFLEINTGQVLQVQPFSPTVQILDGDRIELTTTKNFPVVLEFVRDGVLSNPNHVAVNLTGGETNVDVANAVAAAVNRYRLPGLTATASGDQVDFQGDASMTVVSGAISTSGSYGITTAGAIPVEVGAFGTASTVATAIGNLNPQLFGNRLNLVVQNTNNANVSNVIVGGASVISVVTPSAAWVTPATPTATELGIRFDLTAAPLVDNDSFEITDLNGVSRNFVLDTGQSLNISDPTQIQDGDTFTLRYFDPSFGVRTVTFEFNDGDVDAAFNAARTEIDITGNTATPMTGAAIAQQIATVVNSGGTLGAPLFAGLSATSSPTSTVVDFQGDNAFNFGQLTSASAGVTLVGDYSFGNAIDVPFHATGADIASAAAAFLSANSVHPAKAIGNDLTVANASSASVITPTATYIMPNAVLVGTGNTPGTFPIARVPGESAAETAQRIAATIESATNFEIDVYGSKIVASNGFFGNATTSPSFAVQNTPGGDRITGVTGVETDLRFPGFNTVEMFAVSEQGDLFRVVRNGGSSSTSANVLPFNVGSSTNRGDYIATLTDENGNRIQFSGLTTGPRNLEEGRLADTLFGIDTNGRIHAFDLFGRPQPVFANGATFLDTGRGGATGLAFSNLDVNLWHPTDNSRPDIGNVASNADGVGIEESPDGNAFRFTEAAAGNSSLYFGFENPRTSNSSIQTGTWTGVYDIGDNRANVGVANDYSGDYLTYNFPGGAMGSMESNPLDLSPYSSADRPALYFNYYLETENANDDLAGSNGNTRGDWMLDSLRVFAAGEDGVWRLLATNNSDRTNTGVAGNPDGFDTNILVNPVQPQASNDNAGDEFDQIIAGGTKSVQELYDVGDNGAPNSWRQARIDLDDFAGQSGVRLRFDFSTAGSMAIGDINHGGEELRAVAGNKIADGDTVSLSASAFGAASILEFDTGLELRIPGGASIVSGEYLQLDGTQIQFVEGGAETVGDGVVSYSVTDPAGDIAARVLAELQAVSLTAGFTVTQDPSFANRLHVQGVSASQASAGLPATELTIRAQSSFNFAGTETLRVDNTQISFVRSGVEVVGDGIVNVSVSQTAVQVAAALQAELEAAGFTVNRSQFSDQMTVTGAASARASENLPATFLNVRTGIIAGLPGVLAGNTPVLVNAAMTTNDVALVVQAALAEALNEVSAKEVAATYPIRNGYLIKIYGHQVIDSGPLGLTQHASNAEGSLSPFFTGSDLPGDEFGQFTSNSRDNAFRSQQNAFRGVYIDDIIVGFRERGEMVINGQANQTGFSDNLEYEPQLFTGIGNDTDTGSYQLEIRTAADYGVDLGDGTFGDLLVQRTFNTNDRLAEGVSLNAPQPERVFDGQTFTLSDGTNTVTFEFEDTSLRVTNPNVGVTAGNVVVPFDPSGGMTQAELGRNIRDAINSAQAQAAFKVTASMSDGSVNGSTTALGSPSNSHVIALHGVVAVDNFGNSNFADLNNMTPALTDFFGNIISSEQDDYVLHGVDLFNSVDGGDRNRKRDQGQVLLQGNVITDALTYGINIIPGDRATEIAPLAGVLPHAGPPRATQEYNDERLAPGVTVFNNIVVASGTAGIRISGETTQDAAVPFARIVNNTVYGSGAGFGIQVENNAGPTLSNNIVANVGTGVAVDNSSGATTEISSTLYYRTGTSSTYRGGDLGTSSVLITDGATPVFVDPDNRNFYPSADSPAIDSSREVINDRSYMLTIKGPLGIGASPILAPDRDVTGQFRTDDPNSPLSGTGQNVFKDLGAFERSDFTGPVALLITPQDNDSAGRDRDPNDTYVQLVQGSLNVFEILISDINGTGPDVATIDPDFGPAPDPAVDLSAVSITENGRLLTQGVDYSLGFSPTNGKILLTPLTGIWRPESIYEITLNNRDRIVLTAPDGSAVQDGDQVQVTDENGVTATLEYDSGYVLVVPQTLTLVVPARGGSAVVDGETFTINDGGRTRVFELTSDANFSAGRTPISFAVTDTATQLRDKILVAVNTLLTNLPVGDVTVLQPVAVAGDKIQIGNSPALALSTSGDAQAGLTQQGVAAGVQDGQLITVNHAGGTTTFEFDTDAVSTITAGNVRIPIAATATHEQIAAAIAQAVRAADVELDSARDLGQGVVQLGGTANVIVDVGGSALVSLGTPGVEEGIRLAVPVDAVGVPTVIDGTSFTLTVGGTTVRYEFNDLNIDPATTPGVQVISLTKPDPSIAGLNVLRTADELAAEIVRVVGLSSVGLSPVALTGGEIQLNESLDTSFDLNNSGLTASGVIGGAFAVPFSPLNFSSSRMALELVGAINGIDVASNPNDGPFAGLASLRGSATLFLGGVSSVVDPAGLLSAANISAIRDVAGNPLQPNRPNSETQFTILTPGLALDFGDAPFASSLLENGARHVVLPGTISLGSSVTTTENDANVVGTSATGDAGEDGVDLSLAYFNPRYTASVIQVTVQGNGILEGWVDFNRDGDFDDLGEQIIANRPVSTGTEVISLPAPLAEGFVPGLTYARFRVSQTGGLSSTGIGVGGEVEDYLVENLAGSPPVVNPNGVVDSYSTPEDTTLSVPAASGILQNDGIGLSVFDIDGAGFPKQIQINGGRAGEVRLNRDGSFVFEPAADFYGSGTFTYRAFDGVMPSNELGTVTLTVTPVNDPPVVVNDPVVAAGRTPLRFLEDQVVRIPWSVLLANDGGFPANEAALEDLQITFAEGITSSGPQSVPVTVRIINDGSTPEPMIEIVPQQHSVGTAQFIYHATDNGMTNGVADPLQSTVPATVTLEFLKVNDAPVPDEASHAGLGLAATEDLAFEISVGAILDDDDPAPNRASDRDILELTFQEVALVPDSAGLFPGGVQLATENGGTAVLSTNTLGAPVILYTPPANFFGTDAIFYRIGDTDTSVRGFEPPTTSGTSTGLPQSYLPTTAPADPNNPPTGYQQLADGSWVRLQDDAKTTVGRITLTVNPVNDEPVIANPVFETLEDQTTVFTDAVSQFGITAGPNESGNVVISATGGILTTSRGGTIAIDGNQLTYTPAENFFGTDIIRLTVTETDAPALHTDVEITATVRPVNDAPFDPNAATPTTLNAVEDDTNLIIDLGPLLTDKLVNESGTSEATDADGVGNVPQTLVVQGIRLGAGAPAGASVTLLSNGSVRVTLPRDYFTELDATTSVQPPLNLIYTLSDQGISFVPSAGGGFVAQSDPKTVDVPLQLKVFPVNDAPQGRVHRLVNRVTEDTPFTFDVSELIPTNAIVDGLGIGQGLPAGLDSAGPREDLGGNNVKDTAGEKLSQKLAVLSPNASSAEISTSRGGKVLFIDSDASTAGFEQIRYTPPLNFASSSASVVDTFTYTIQDDGLTFTLDANGNPVANASSLRSTGTVEIQVVPVNDPPQFVIDQNVTVSEDTASFDPNNPGHVTLPGFVKSVRPGPADALDEVSQGVRFQVTTTNSGLFDQIAIDNAGVVTQRPDISISPNGDLDFNLQLHQNGIAIVTVTAIDDDPANPQQSTSQQFTITVNAVNDPPEFGYANAPDDPTRIQVTEGSGFYLDSNWASPRSPGPASALDERGQGVNFVVSTDRPELFALVPSITSTGALRFTPAPDRNGDAVVTITAVDTGPSTGDNVNRSAPVLLTISIVPVNDIPVAMNDSYNADENTLLQVPAAGLLANDVDVDGDALFIHAFGGQSQGTLTGTTALGATVTFVLNDQGEADGGFIYDPINSQILDRMTTGESLVDSFNYQVVDSNGVVGVSEGRVSITVAGRNDAPRLSTTQIRVASNRATVINVLDLVVDPEPAIGGVPSVDISSLAISLASLNGTLTNNGNGTLTYNPRQGYQGADSFQFTIADAQGNRSEPLIVSMQVSDTPITSSDQVRTTLNREVDINVLANDQGVAAPLDPGSLRISAQPAEAAGTVQVQPGGVIRFIPATGFVGVAQFRYTVADTLGLTSDPTTVVVSVSRSAGQNLASDRDVNDSGQISPIDALVVINHLNRQVANDVETLVNNGTISIDSGPFMDVNGDGFVTPADALRVINFLNGATGAAGEAQTFAAPDVSEVVVGAASWMHPEPEQLEELTPAKATSLALGQFDSESNDRIDLDITIDEIAQSRQDQEQLGELDDFWSNF